MKKPTYKITRKFVCILIVAALLLALAPMAALAEDTQQQTPACEHEECAGMEACAQAVQPQSVAIELTRLDAPAALKVAPGEQPALPQTLKGYDADDAEYSVAISWACDTFDANKAGPYTFAATITDAAAFALAEGVALPALEVTVEQKTEVPQPIAIAAIDALAEGADEITVPLGTEIKDIPFPALYAGGEELAGAVWTCDGYDAQAAGEYAFTPALPKDKYALAEGAALPTVTVKVAEAAIVPMGGFVTLANQDYTIVGTDGVDTIQNGIHAWLNGMGNGDTLTVTGSKTGITTANGTLAITIPEGVTVIWQATWTGEVSGSPMINLGGAGTFDMTAGTISNSGTAGGSLGVSIASADITLKVSGADAKVSAAGDAAIYGNGSVEVSAGTVSSGRQGIEMSDGSVTVSGGSVSGTGNGIYVTGGNTVTVSGGTVSGDSAGITISANNCTVNAEGGSITSADGSAVAFINASGTLHLGGAALSWAVDKYALQVAEWMVFPAEVTVTGTSAGAAFPVNLNRGNIVKWQASCSGSVAGALVPVTGRGTFEVATDGSIANSDPAAGSHGPSATPQTVTVAGTHPDTTSAFPVNISNNQIVKWQANYKSTVNTAVVPVMGSGTFEVSGGSIVNESFDTVSHGVSTALGIALKVSGGNVEAPGGIATKSAGSVTMTGGAVSGITGISGDSVSISDGDVTGTQIGIELSGTNAKATVSGSGAVSGGFAGIVVSGVTNSTLDATGGSITSTSGPALLYQNASGTLNLGGAALSWANGNSVLDVSGNPNTPQTVTVTDAQTGAAGFPVKVENGHTVKLHASYTADSAAAPVQISGGGTFELASGNIINTGGPAIEHKGAGVVTVSGGLAFGRGAGKDDVIKQTSGTFAGPTGAGMVVAWATPGQKQYVPGSTEDLAVFPATSAAKAMWEASAGQKGIRYDNGSGNSGLVPIDVIVSGIYDVIVNFPEVRDNTKPVTGTIDAPYKHLANGGYVEVNRKRIKEGTDYTHKEGSTVISLTPAYLQTLPNDSYTVDVYFANGGKASTSLHVRVLATYTIKATAGEHGTITPSGDVQVTETHNQTFTFTPDAGYVVDTVTVDGAAVTPVNNSYTFEAVSQNSTIHVTFRAIDHSPINPPDKNTPLDTAKDITITFKGNWENVKDIRLNGVSLKRTPTSTDTADLSDYKNYNEVLGNAKKSSVAVTLYKKFLQWLPDGMYALEVEFDDGGVVSSGAADFLIRKDAQASTVVASGSASPKTGDGANMALYIALVIIAGVAIAGVAVYRRRKAQKGA